MKQITPPQLQERLAAAHDLETVLLDVREPHEYAYAHIEGCVHIPMQEVPRRVGELNASTPIVVICHHGMRSAQVANFLDRQGFSDVMNLTGGIDAWSLQVDPSLRRY